MENPVDRTLKNWLPAAAGFLAAAFAVARLHPFPPRARTIPEVLLIYAMAVAYTLIVLASSAAAAWLAWFLLRLAARGKSKAPPRALWRTSSRAVWLLPLYLFAAANSFWAVIVTVLLTLGLVHVLRNLQPASRQRPALSSGMKIFSCILAAAAIEAASIAAGVERERQAIPIAAFATLIVAWHATRGGRKGHPSRGLITVFLAIVFSSGALVRNVGTTPGDRFFGFPIDPAIEASVDVLQKSFGGGPVAPLAPAGTKPPKASGDANVNVAGMPHLGIFLWPEVKKETTLVPPLPQLGRKAFAKDRKTALTIPFYGAYWFFRSPFRQPPFGSLVMHGSPALRSFLSNDGSPLLEEAQQDLQTDLDLSWCQRIELDVINADHLPRLVQIELLMVDRTGERLTQSLGAKPLTTTPDQTAIPETLEYPIPPGAITANIKKLIVRFQLSAPRQTESAQVELLRFRLVPKGGLPPRRGLR